MRDRSILAIFAAFWIASCAPRPAPPLPTPPVVQPQARPEPPRPLPPPPPAAWEDASLAVGDWSYRGEGNGSAASFGLEAATFVIHCEPGGQVTLTLPGATRGPMTVRTSSGARNVAAEPRRGALVATLRSSDALLDEIIFSRGRFAVEAEGLARLVLPAWGEPARVVEDCRG